MADSSPYSSASSRASYPVFIPLAETLLLHLNWAKAGLIDAFRWDYAAKLITSDAEIQGNVLKSGLLNGVSLVSIWVFEFLVGLASRRHGSQVDPASERGFVHRNLGWFYQALWLAPIVGTSLYLNSAWCSVVARRAFILQHGNRAVAQQQSVGYTGMLNSLATSAYRGVMILSCALLSLVLSSIPLTRFVLGPILAFAFFCWVDSYYCFEGAWVARGFSLPRRVRHIEERWAYYLAFGMPAAFLCNWGNSLTNAAIFALIYPYYIIMATRSRPLPADPYNPIPSEGADVIRYPSPFVPLQLPIFRPVILMNNLIVRILTVGAGGKRTASPSLSSTGAGAKFRRKGAGGSVDGFDNIEEGGDTETIELHASAGSQPTPPSLAAGRRRVNIGRKKLD